MKSFTLFLQEGKQVGILYHYTSIPNLIKITKLNMLRPMGYEGVSFTRDKHFHRVDRDDETVQMECRFVVDGNKLSHNYKVQPFNYFAADMKYYKHSPKVDEQEEVVKTAVRDLDKYVIKLQIYKTSLIDNYEGEWLSDKDFAEFPTQEDLIKFLETKFEVELI